jgi:hypothetical protein
METFCGQAAWGEMMFFVGVDEKKAGAGGDGRKPEPECVQVGNGDHERALGSEAHFRIASCRGLRSVISIAVMPKKLRRAHHWRHVASY